MPVLELLVSNQATGQATDLVGWICVAPKTPSILIRCSLFITSLFPPGSVMVPANIASADPRIHASSSSRIHFPESRPSPVHRATWSSTRMWSIYDPFFSPLTKVCKTLAFVPNLKIHKTIALSPGQPSLVYNIIFKPSHQNILNGSTMTPISAHTLALSATLPRVTELTLTCRELMWPIVVTSTANPQHAITNLDVIEAVHAQLNVPATRREWEALGHNSKPQARVADAYNRRCAQTRDWDNGVRRVDWLQGRTVLVGIESTPNGHELVFSK